MQAAAPFRVFKQRHDSSFLDGSEYATVALKSLWVFLAVPYNLEVTIQTANV